MRRAGSIVLLFGCLTLLAPIAPAGTHDPGDLIAHEWGTFTSVAGVDGRAVEWLPQAGPSDLPSFVERLQVDLKGLLRATVRMETPVIYFYSPRETTVDVRVAFPGGAITEWFPRARVTPAAVANSTVLRRSGFVGTIAWQDVQVVPRSWTEFRTERGPSHYYAARAVDASPIAAGSDREMFLFYRGVASVEPPVAATVAGDGTVKVSAAMPEPLGDVVLFENRRGRIAYEVQRAGGSEATFPPALPQAPIDALFDELEGMLVANGLYPREAKAMIATWRDSWFEEGTRLFYVVPPRVVDEMLPLEIRPRPRETVRVFVGRIELITAGALEEVRAAMAANDERTLARYGRFLQPIRERLEARSPATVRTEIP